MRECLPRALDVQGASFGTSCSICAMGYYCVVSTHATQVACPAGRYGAVTGLVTSVCRRTHFVQ